MTYEPVTVVGVRAWGVLVGAVTRDPATGFFLFEFDDAWVRRGMELAPLRMPARRGQFEFPELSVETYKRLPAMLADSLPDRWGSALVSARLEQAGVRREDITSLDRLAYAADRAMGALEYFPPILEEAHRATAIQLSDLVTAARRVIRHERDGDQVIAGLRRLIQVGTSAGGIRPKAVICLNPETGEVRSGQFNAPPGYQHWLVKLDGVEDRGDLGIKISPAAGHGRIEYAYSRMAGACGIEMTECRLLEEHGRAHFMTRRFDRGGDGTKVHTQTLCALDHLDYNLADTHDYAQLFDVIDRLGLGPEVREQAFRRVAMNVTGVNRDDHTKNFSFCCGADGSWTLAPAYDLTHAYNPSGRWTQRHQMSVNGKFEGIERADLLELADRFAVPSARRALSEVLETVGRWPEYAEEAGVDGATNAEVGRRLAEFRPI
ncbi:MAG: type II toxin-antitoxin system HipA family toxin [Acidimicrobiales bacterium]